MNTRQLSYTPDGQIKSIRDSTQDKQGNKTEKLIATYQYNHLRQRIAKSTYHKDDKTGQIKEETTQYLWYKGLLSAEIKDDKVVRRYIYLDIMPAAVLDYGYDSKGKLNETKVYSVHTDHLGTPKAVSDKDKNIVWQAKMDTFGETKSIDSKNGFEFNLRFAGQYYDDETGYHYNYHRYYDPNIGRYLTSDPIGLAGRLNSYGYANGRPYEFVDVYGLKVILTLNRSTNTLTVIDTDHYQAGLPMVNNLPSTYKFGGIRDKNGKLTTNQMLIIRNVFTGGQTYEGVGIYRNPERLSVQQPIPVGIYHIVTNRGDTNPKHADWFRLDAQDSIPFNDRHEPTGRDGFRLHSGMESHGCTTFDVYNQEAMLGWSVLKQILNSTSTSLVRDKRGRQGYDPLALMENYGQIEITGKDGISIFEDNK